MFRMVFSEGCNVQNARFGHVFDPAVFVPKLAFRVRSHKKCVKLTYVSARSQHVLGHRSGQSESCVSEEVTRLLLRNATGTPSPTFSPDPEHQRTDQKHSRQE